MHAAPPEIFFRHSHFHTIFCGKVKYRPKFSGLEKLIDGDSTLNSKFRRSLRGIQEWQSDSAGEEGGAVFE
jgi:hypothetical protein